MKENLVAERSRIFGGAMADEVSNAMTVYWCILLVLLPAVMVYFHIRRRRILRSLTEGNLRWRYRPFTPKWGILLVFPYGWVALELKIKYQSLLSYADWPVYGRLLSLRRVQLSLLWIDNHLAIGNRKGRVLC